MRRFPPLAALLVLVVLALPVGAQTSPTIEQGVFTMTGSSFSPLIRFTLAGPNLLTLSGGMRDGNHNPRCSPCLGGDSILISDSYSGATSFISGTWGTGSETRTVYYDGNVTIGSAQFTLPTRFNRYIQTVIMPITLKGNLSVHSASPIGEPHLLFDIPLNLEGKATLTFRTLAVYNIYPFLPSYEILSLTYEFPRPAQTEEVKQ